MSKDELRETMRRRLRALDRTTIATASESIVRAIADTAAWRRARMVCGFLPLRSEPQIQPLWSGESGPAWCFPRIVGAGLELIQIDDRARLSSATWKLDAPEFSACPTVAPAQVEVILVPGLAFTHDGRRLGRGGGWYDRLLAQCLPETVRLGVCFDCQIVAELPTEPHDQRVAAVITE